MTMRIISSFLLIFISNCVLAQKEGRFVEASQKIIYQFTVTSYSTREGLPENQILDIEPKKNGSLLLATANGIVEYNGQEFNEFIKDNRYKKHTVSNLMWDEYSQKLFVNEFGGGLYVFHPYYKCIQRSLTSTIHQHTIYAILKSGDIYSADTKICAFKKIGHTEIKNALSVSMSYPYVYIGTNNGLYSYHLKTKKVSQLLNNKLIHGFYFNPYNKHLYGYGIQDIYELNQNHVSRLNSFNVQEKRTVIKGMTAIAKDQFYVTTTHGLHYVTPEYSELYRTEVLPSDNLISIYFNDQEDCLFVGSTEKGLFRLLGKNCYSYPCIIDEHYKQSSTSSIVRTPEGKIIAGGADGRIYEISFGRTSDYWTFHTNIASLASIGRYVYVGTWGAGIYVLDNRKIIYQVTQQQLGDGNVHTVFKDSQGTIWVGTNKGIAKGKNHYSIRPYLNKSISGIIICFYERRDGSICIGTSNGVYILNKHYQLIKSLNKTDGLFGKEVRSFYEDHSGKLWIGTYNGGLFCYDNGKLTSINRKKNCKLQNEVFTLAKGPYGYLNMTSNYGLWKVSEKDLTDFYNGKLDRLIPFFFGEENGILNTEFNGGFQHNYLLTKNNHFYFPSIEGIVIHTPQQYTYRKMKPVIDRIWVNDTLYKEDVHLFERTTHTIQFDFSSPFFHSKYNHYYQYKLEGGELFNGWSRLEKHASISFKMLPPGKYHLKIRAVDAFNDRHPYETTFSFTIKPYFYETFWFRAIVVLLFLLIIGIIVRARIIFIRNRERNLSSINNTILELKLKAIQAKMNPHFIFNALNNIQYLIVLKKLEPAEEALNEFSQLLRKFLQQSDQTFVTLDEEFEMLQLYVAIEKFRFEEQLFTDFHIETELKQYYIPSMLLQPLLENALKHGLLLSEKERILKVRAFRFGAGIRVSIEDNGIGREASQEINKHRQEHISHGLQLVQEKIKIVYEKYGIIIRFQLTDIKDDSITGTIIIFDIPIITENFKDN